MHKKHRNEDMILLAISDEPLAKVSPFVKKNDIPYIVGADAKPVFNAFGVKGYPTFFVIDSKGIVTYRGSDFDKAAKALDKALKDRPADSKGGGLEEDAAKVAYDKALKLYQKKEYAKAMKAFGDVVKNFKGTEAADKAAERIKSMKASKKIMAQIRAAEEKKRCESWLELARTLAQNGKRDEAVDYYQKIVKEYPDSSFADIAKKEMAAL